MKSVNRKLNELEDHVLKPPKLGTTRLYIEDEAESALLEKCQQMAAYHDNSIPLTKNERFLLDQMSKIMWVRALDIFEQVVGVHIYGDNGISRVIFNLRLTWFIEEISQQIGQQRMEDEISMQEGKPWKQIEKELDQFYKEHWKPCFTKESFEKHVKEALSRSGVCKTVQTSAES